jgi:hypothetical protein
MEIKRNPQISAMDGGRPSARQSCTKRRMTSASTGFDGATPAALFSMQFRSTRREYGRLQK